MLSLEYIYNILMALIYLINH